MRRIDREMGVEFGLYVIDKARFGVLSCVTGEGLPYAIPLSIARAGNVLYFHSAKLGTKVDLLQDGTRVCIVFVGDVVVPELYSVEELEDMVKDKRTAAELTRRVFTTQYESTIVKGTVRRVVDEAEFKEGLRVVSEKFVPTKMPYFEAAYEAGKPITYVYAIDMDEITAKRKKYDKHGVEMKFQREEED